MRPGRPGPPDLLRALTIPSLLFLLTAVVSTTSAQVPAHPVLRGRVLHNGRPLTRGTVILHEVAPDTAGPLDSLRLGSDGRFRFELPAEPGATGGPVFFASVRFQGVMYFSTVVHLAAQLDSAFDVQVYDTTTVPAAGTSLPVTARNLLMEHSADGWSVTDLFQVQNKGKRTLVPRPDGVVWTYPLPSEATNFQVGESDLAPNAVRFSDGAIRVSSPVPPGQRTYIIRYTLPDLPATVPLPGTTTNFELLVKQPAPQLTVAGAQPAQPVEIEPGSNYRRYSADRVVNATVKISAGGVSDTAKLAWIAIALAVVLAGAGVFAVRRMPEARPAGASPESREALLLRIAALDDAYENAKGLSKAEREGNRAERGRLLTRLRELE